MLRILPFVFLHLSLVCHFALATGTKGPLARVYVFKAANSPTDLELMGIVDFSENGKKVMLNGTLSGLTPGEHGFHIHQFGNIDQKCAAAGPHFNPHGREHGAPTDENRHVGDLGNINADANGQAIIKISDEQLKLSGHHNILGRALVVHEKRDDLGKVANEESRKTGNAGKRIGCGIIGSIEEASNFSKEFRKVGFLIVVLASVTTFLLTFT